MIGPGKGMAESRGRRTTKGAHETRKGKGVWVLRGGGEEREIISPSSGKEADEREKIDDL